VLSDYAQSRRVSSAIQRDLSPPAYDTSDFQRLLDEAIELCFTPRMNMMPEEMLT